MITAPCVPSNGFTAVGIAVPPVLAYLLNSIVTVPEVVGAVHKSAIAVAPPAGVAPENAIAVAPTDAVEEIDTCCTPYAVAVATVPAPELVPGVADTATVVETCAYKDKTPPATTVAVWAVPDDVSFKYNPVDRASACPEEAETPECETADDAILVATNSDALTVPLLAAILSEAIALCALAEDTGTATTKPNVKLITKGFTNLLFNLTLNVSFS